MDGKRYDDLAERLFEAPCAVIDFLPERVPAESGGQYFAAERFYLKRPLLDILREKFAHVLVKLSCYYGFAVCGGSADGDPCGAAGDPCPADGWTEAPGPETLFLLISECAENGFRNVLIPSEDALIAMNGDDLYLTLYHPSERLLDLVRQLAASEGLFVREGA